METEPERKFLAHRIWKLQNANFTTDSRNGEREFDGADIMKLISTDDEVRLAVCLLFTVFLLLFLAVIFAVSFAINRCICAKSDEIISPEKQIESDKTVLKLPSAEKLQGAPVVHHVTSPPLQRSLDNLPQPIRKEIYPEIQATTSANYYHHIHHEQQQQHLFGNWTSLPGYVPKHDGGLLTHSDPDTDSCNYRARIWFSLTFGSAEVSREIIVHISKVEVDVSPRDLLCLERWKEMFVCAYLLPDESQQLRTKAVDRTGTSVIVNETLVFKLDPSSSTEHLMPSILRLSVYQLDQHRLRHTLGHVIIPLDDRCDLGSNYVIVCEDLISDEALSNYNSLGEIRLALTFDPEVSKMKVTVIEARGLRGLDIDQELYIIVQLLIGDRLQKTKRIENLKRKTSETSNNEEAGCPSPSDHFIYNDTVQFTLPVSQLDISTVRVSIMIAADHQGHSADHWGHSGDGGIEYGRTTLGPFMYAHGDQLDHWTVVSTQPHETVTRWHRLTSASGRRH